MNQSGLAEARRIINVNGSTQPGAFNGTSRIKNNVFIALEANRTRGVRYP